MRSFFSELRRRKVLQTGATYVVGAVTVWGALEFSAEAFGLSSAVLRHAIVASAVGLPLALIASWFLDVRLEATGGEGTPSTANVVLASLSTGALAGTLVFAGLVLTLPAPDTDLESSPLVREFGERGAIAVLPFDDLSPEAGHQHFADGVADEILTSLQAWGIFPVISKGSTTEYRERDADLPTVAAELGVRYLVEGSVRIVGDAVRVTCRLVDGETDTQLWADRIDGDLNDIFAVQEEISERIVTAIAPEMTRNEMRRASRAMPQEIATWELVLRAQALLARQTYEDAMQARDLLELALEREPRYALAYARLAEIGHDASNNMSREFGEAAAQVALDTALVHAGRAVQLDPSLVDAHIWLGHLLLHQKQVPEGVAELREAVRLNPSHAQAQAELAFGLAIQGDVEGSMRALELATSLSPNDPRNDRIRTFEAIAYLDAGEYARAAATARSLIRLRQGSPSVLVTAVVEIAALVREDRMDEARQRVDEFEASYGPLDWPALARGAWSDEELSRVRADLVAVGMLDG
ncbi:MAG TPA: hypothetical protein VK858_12355 [Longimicrobiales bacterium]|nr:hypothetical protein [Longimicrobiales bacterium]